MKHLILLFVLGGTAFDDEPSREPSLAAELHSRGWITFSAHTPHGDWDLFLMRPDGSERRALTDTREFNEAGARFSPDGKRLLSYPGALVYFGAMFGGGASTETTALLAEQLYAPGKLVVLAVAAMILCAPFQAHDWSEHVTWPKAILVPPAFATAVLAMFSQAANPFLYFQF